MLPESYDPLLVALSYVVAVAGSYTGTSLGERLTGPSRRLRVPWFLGLTLVQATCIWSAHFLGWLALRLPVPVAYDLPLTIASAGVAAAGVAGATALFAWEYSRRRDLFPARIVARGALFGLGIAGLHYTVMAAMRMAARTHHSAPWDRASIAFVIVVGTLGIWIGTRYFRPDARRSLWLKVAVALIAGTAITGQHYIAMAGADFSPGPDTRPSSEWLLAGPNLPLTVLLTTLVILTGGLVSAGLDRRKAARDTVSWRMLAGRENERRGIARVLHDDVGQTLTTLRLNLQRLHPLQGEAPIVADSVALVDDALTRVRALSLELRPSVLDDLGLAAAVAWYANRQAERAGYTVKVVENVGRKRFDESVETAAFRVVQEALTNVTRHAQAKNIRVSMRLAAPLLDVAISDDGVGFNVAEARERARAGESLGLLDMKEIATLAGATYSIASAPGKGSTVTLSFHLAGD